MEKRSSKNFEEKSNIYNNQLKVNYKYPNSDDEFIDFSEFWNLIKRRRKIIVFSTGVVILSVFSFTLLTRIFSPVYKGSFTILISDPMSPNNQNKGGFNLGNTDLFENLAQRNDKYDTDTLITLLKSPLFLTKTAEAFDMTYGELEEKISINQRSQVKRSDAKGILNVELIIKNKKKGRLILENLSEFYIEAALERRQQKLNDGLEFLNKQAPQIQRRTRELQTQLVNFREENLLLEPTLEGGTLKTQLKEIDLQILQLQTERDRLINVKKEIKNGTLSARGFEEEIGGTSSLGEGLKVSDFDQSLLQQLITVEKELANAKSKYTPTSSIIKSLEQRLKQIQPLLLQNQLEAVDTALKLNEGRLISSSIQKKSLEGKFLRQPELIKKYQNIEQELKIANQNLISLVSAREKFQLEMAQNSLPWNIISKPNIQEKPISPSFKKNISFGVVLGVFVGIIVGLIRDKTDNVYHFPSEAEEYLNIPLIGHIPHIEEFKNVRVDKVSITELLENKNSQKINQNNYSRFFYQEAFRNLFTSIRFLGTDRKLKLISITSSMPGEGKSLINLILAKTLADIGNKVLVIDGDLRKPQIHTRLGINNLIGLSNLVTDPTTTVDNVIQKLDKNLSVITAGTKPPDPTRLLSSERFKKIISELRSLEKFDYVIFDVPPIVGLSDASLIAEQIDGVILLISLGYVNRNLPKESIKTLKRAGDVLIGTITNETLKKLDQTKSTYGYAYGYGYYNAYSSYAYEYDDSNKNTNIKDKKNYALKIFELFKNKSKNLLTWLDN